jgi:hypothetical protein
MYEPNLEGVSANDIWCTYVSKLLPPSDGHMFDGIHTVHDSCFVPTDASNIIWWPSVGIARVNIHWHRLTVESTYRLIMKCNKLQDTRYSRSINPSLPQLHFRQGLDMTIAWCSPKVTTDKTWNHHQTGGNEPRMHSPHDWECSLYIFQRGKQHG